MKEGSYNSLGQPFSWSMAAILDKSVVVTVDVRTHLRAIPLAMITMRKSTHGFSLCGYGAPLDGPSGCRSSDKNILYQTYILT